MTKLNRSIVYLPFNTLERVLQGGKLESTGLPSTAEMVSVHHDPQRASFCIIYQDASFEATPPGCRYPELQVNWQFISTTTVQSAREIALS